jgi:hypothetical protein
MVGAFVGVNYGTIQISGKLALEFAVSELIEWTLVGIVVGLMYEPRGPDSLVGEALVPGSFENVGASEAVIRPAGSPTLTNNTD